MPDSYRAEELGALFEQHPVKKMKGQAKMMVSMIVALGRNRVIGSGNAMPWHIPVDLKYFKARTLGKPLIMGRKTLQSIGGALPGRPNIVVTRDKTFAAEGVTLVESLDQALIEAKAHRGRYRRR